MQVSTVQRNVQAPGRPDVSQPDSVLSKAHLLLSAFRQGVSTLGLTELSRRSGVSKASAHRLATELVELGYLTRTLGGYQLGLQVFELGRMVPGPAILRDVARPAMQDLRVVTRGIVHLAVPEGGECVYLDRIAGRNEVVVISSVGDRVPFHTTASGRIFLAHSDPGTIDQLDTAGLAALGARNQAEATAILAGIRTRRYAEERSTCFRGAKALAVPVVYPDSEQVVAAISVTVPLERRDEQDLLRALWATSSDIRGGLLRTYDDSMPYHSTKSHH
ncbi:IclR family transcriptional regulator [Pseudarthrobacter sp. TAF60_1]|uniref:IclR family transcriptional regulator n=1 Tax=Pseudarthrobacter sp. TAF60_1 TaxID=3233071 RepID=UPI003F9447EA